jgi:hypothetical protein
MGVRLVQVLEASNLEKVLELLRPNLRREEKSIRPVPDEVRKTHQQFASAPVHALKLVGEADLFPPPTSKWQQPVNLKSVPWVAPMHMQPIGII